MLTRSANRSHAPRFSSAYAPGFLVLLAINFASVSVSAATGDDLAKAHARLTKPEFNEKYLRTVQDVLLSQKDFELHLDSGAICFLDPVVLNGDSIRCCGYFQGRGRLVFRPTPRMERGQLRRFCGDDSLFSSIEDAVLYFEPAAYHTILQAVVDSTGDLKIRSDQRFRKLHRNITKNTYRDRIATLLRSLANPGPDTFLMVSTELKKENKGSVLYVYDPYEREEVQFFKLYNQIIDDFMEDVCMYSAQAGPNHEAINGSNKDEIAVRHYVTDAAIGNKAEYRASIKMTFDVLRPPAQVLQLDLGSTIILDSITYSTDGRVEFARVALDHNEFGQLHLFLDRPLTTDETVTLTFHCGGKIAHVWEFEFLVPVSSDWYPSYGWRQQSTFDMKFRVPDRLELVAVGQLADRQVVKDSVRSHYLVSKPISNCAFSVGRFSHYEFREENAPPVQVYYSEDLHREGAYELGAMMIPTGRHMEKQVAYDVIGALQLFGHYFGPYSDSILTITEILTSHGLAYPGFIQFGVGTWINTDAWGNDRLFRAHETAHQWWGIGVIPETYHDAWLSEAFAEYSALMYLQAVAGNGQFLGKLDQYRDLLFGVRKPIFGSRDETGTISLGYRNSTTETAGDYSLLIYKKGAFVLHMLRNMLIDLQTMKEDQFFALMQDWYSAYKDSMVTTDDFRRHCEKHLGVDMGWFFRQWIDGTDLPTYKLTYELEQNEKQYWVAHCHISQTDVPDDFTMYVPIDIDFGDKRHYYVRALVDRPTVDFDLPALDLKPKKLKLNPFQSVLCKVQD